MNRFLLAITLLLPGAGWTKGSQDEPLMLASAGHMGMGYSSEVYGGPAKMAVSNPAKIGSKEIKYYKDGPWKGGKAVIQHSKDQTKTTVRVFNKKGKLVKTMVYKRPAAKAAKLNKASKVAAAEAIPMGSDTVSLAKAMPDLPELQAGAQSVNKKELQFAQSMQALAQIDSAKLPTQVGDPERNVRPVYPEDELRGARMGRYREFEKRRVVGRNSRSSVQGYDYYVEETDRKEGTRTVTYFRDEQGKARKVAMEQFEGLSFFSNYDIKSLGQAKVKNY